MKNPNGYGATYKLPGRRRKPWVARITTGWKTVIATRGKRKGQEVPRQVYQIIGYFETRQQARDALALHRVSPAAPKVNMTLAEVYAEWSAGKYKYISKATENNYRAAWKYMAKYEKAKFADLRAGHWQEVIDTCKEQGLSKSSIEKIRTLAVMLSDHAMKNDIINKNYATLVDMPKFETVKKERFTDLEVLQMEKKAADVPWADTVLILIYTGLRISEMLGLTRFNIDMDKQVITGGIKTDAGKDRVIPIHPKIKAYVQTWLDRNGDALICNDQGKKISAKKYREDYYYPALDAMEIRRLTPHACRHTFCSRLADAGVDPLYIKELAGHAQYSFTADKYTHPDFERLKQAISKL